MSEGVDSKFKKLEVEYAHLLKYFSDFEKIKNNAFKTTQKDNIAAPPPRESNARNSG